VKDLIILGTQVHAQEMVEIVERVNAVSPQWKLKGYLSQDGVVPGTELNGYPVLAGEWSSKEHAGAVFALSYGVPREALPPRERLVSLLDPSAFISRTASIGVGCVIYPSCYVGLKAKVGDYVFCLSGSIINHDDVVEDRVAFASGVVLAGNLHIEEGCYLGQACSVRQFVRVGRGSTIGMGAVVVKDVAPGSVMVGNPARVLVKEAEA
jgi:sugar O-acyltransferase (sialic acid O-acetyltransferase NeuD family)